MPWKPDVVSKPTAQNKPQANKHKKTSQPKSQKKPLSKMTVRDSKVSVTAEILRGDGIVIKKRLLGNSEKVLNFDLELSIEDQGQTIKSISAFLKTKTQKLKLSGVKRGLNSFDIALSMLSSPQIVVTVVVVYKVRLLTSKELKLKVTRNY